jgi:hypothetical protein
MKKYYTNLTPTQEQRVLEMYDYCNQKTGAIVTDDVKIFEKNGLLSMTSLHWFQIVVEYIMPILLDGRYYIQDTFLTRCLQHKTIHPVDFLYEKFQAIINNEPLMKETKLEYVTKIEEKAKRLKK